MSNISEAYTVDAYEKAAFISNEEGYDVAFIRRLEAGPDADGFRTDAPLADDDWQRLVNVVAAAPLLLRSCVDLLAALADSRGGYGDGDLHANPEEIMDRANKAIQAAGLTLSLDSGR